MALCLVSGCAEAQHSGNGSVIPKNDTISAIDQDAVIAIALNDSEVKGYLRNGYTIKNTGPVCYEQSLSDRKIYRSCFTGVEIETKEVYLVAYVDTEKRVVNKTLTMYIRTPVIAPSELITAVP